MKYLLFVFALLLINVTFGQKEGSITVRARAIYKDQKPVFKASVSLSGNYSSFPSEAVSFEQMKVQYDKALQAQGLSLTDLVENHLAYTILGYEKEGTVYEYTTDSLNEFESFLATKSFGVQRLSYGSLSKIDKKKAKQLLHIALTNAKAKAIIIAEAMGKHLGDIILLEDDNLVNAELFKSMFYDQPIAQHWYDIKVTFALNE